jgi:S-adenosylmethionine:tRNA ribosyltransferase-isomerase
VALREEIALDPLEPPNDLVHQPADLREVPADRRNLCAQAVLKGIAESRGEACLELRRGCGECLDLFACAFERGVDGGGLDPPGGRAVDPFLCALDCFWVHGGPRYRAGRMDLEELDYELPPELIAQEPAARRDESRLLVYERSSGAVRHRRFAELPLELGIELVVVNDTRVVPARIPIESPRGEVLLLERVGGDEWIALARPTRRLKAGSRYGPVELIEHLGEGRWRLRLDGEPAGQTPLPPYITAPLADPERYQTVYAREAGSAAAPTAGLHFTEELLGRVNVERVTLHVGLDTFRPVTEPRLEEHVIHGERYEVSAAAWERIRAAERVLAVGTTTVRTLETVAHGGPLTGRTELFIVPGFEFRRVDALLTNFHLPRSTLLALVMAFAGIDEIRRLYALAVEERYRFYSFGDAMLIL